MTSTRFRWIRSPDEVSALGRSLSGVPRLAVDTEYDSFHHYRFKVCVIQVADSRDEVVLIDPLAARDLSGLAPVFDDPATMKVFHNAEYDIALLKRDFGFTVRSVFDTELAARFAGHARVALDALLESELGITHGKKLQRVDWSRRPLSPAHEKYLTGDVCHLLGLAERLESEVAKLGRASWVREECDALAETPPAGTWEPADFLKAKGARDLTPRQLALLRELFKLREEWSRNADLPPFKIAGDEALMAITRRWPSHPGDLERVPGLSDRIRSRLAGEIIAAVKRADSIPMEELPKFTYGRRTHVSRPVLKRVERLKRWRDGAAKRLDLDPGLLLPRWLIARIAAAASPDLETLAAVPDIRRWRVEAFGGEFVDALR